MVSCAVKSFVVLLDCSGYVVVVSASKELSTAPLRAT